MSKKNKNYELKSDAVDKLLKAEKGDVPEFSEEELRKYKTGGKFKIPNVVKVLFLKAWFAGAVCYFILWGLGFYINNLIDMLFVLGVVLGMATDLLTNNDKWLMFPKKGMVSFFLNMVYAIVLIICVYFLYGVINRTLIAVMGNPEQVPLGVEPVMFGIFTMGFDVLFIKCKDLMNQIIKDARRSL